MQSPVTIPCSQAVIHSSLVRASHQNLEDCGLDSYCGLPFFSSKHFFMYLITIFSFVTLEIVMRKTIIKFNEKGVCLTKLFTDVCLVVHLIFPVKNCLNTALKTQIPTQVMQRTSQHRTPKGLYNRYYLQYLSLLYELWTFDWHTLTAFGIWSTYWGLMMAWIQTERTSWFILLQYCTKVTSTTG